MSAEDNGQSDSDYIHHLFRLSVSRTSTVVFHNNISCNSFPEIVAFKSIYYFTREFYLSSVRSYSSCNTLA